LYPFGYISYGAVDNTTGLQTMRDAGSRWVTTRLSWSTVQPTRTALLDWSSFDAKVLNAQAAESEIFVLFTDNPQWAAETRYGPVTDTQDLVGFVGPMAERYDCDGVDDALGGPCIRYWSFYPEPDHQDRWGNDGSGFAEMLSVVAPAIHAASPRAQILIGGLAYDWFTAEGGPFVRSFLTDTLAALNAYPGGARAYVDAAAFHFYPIAPQRWPTIREKADEVRGVLQSHGVGDLPVSCPEMGFWSSPKYGSSDRGQASRLVKMFVRALSADVQPLCWYEFQDRASPGTVNDTMGVYTCGLVDVSGEPKPSYTAYSAMTRELGWSTYTGRLDAVSGEGYLFRTRTASDRFAVWGDEATSSMSFDAACLRVVRVVDDVTFQVLDGDVPWDWDNRKNGRILLGLGTAPGEPFFVEECP
jgi:hypothetical protein